MVIMEESSSLYIRPGNLGTWERAMSGLCDHLLMGRLFRLVCAVHAWIACRCNRPGSCFLWSLQREGGLKLAGQPGARINKDLYQRALSENSSTCTPTSVLVVVIHTNTILYITTTSHIYIGT